MQLLYRFLIPFFVVLFLGLCWGVLTQHQSRYVYVAAYVVATVFLSWILSQSHDRLKIHSFWLFAITLGMFGPYGLIGCCVFSVIEITNKRKFHNIEDDIEEIVIKPVEDSLIEEERHLLNQELNMQSYFDILCSSNVALKKALISRFLYRQKISDIPLLKKALDDDEYEIRTFASTTLSRTEKFFNNVISEMRDHCNEHPENLKLRFKLCYKYYLYIKSGILTPELEYYYVIQTHALMDEIRQNQELSPLELLKLQVFQLVLNPFETDELVKEQCCKSILLQYPKQRHAISQLAAVYFKKRDSNSLFKLSQKIETLPANYMSKKALILWSKK
jgi:hypothetical protein